MRAILLLAAMIVLGCGQVDSDPLKGDREMYLMGYQNGIRAGSYQCESPPEPSHTRPFFVCVLEDESGKCTRTMLARGLVEKRWAECMEKYAAVGCPTGINCPNPPRCGSARRLATIREIADAEEPATWAASKAALEATRER
jgi:hypothetical protein